METIHYRLNALPLFKSHYSHRSILTWEKYGASKNKAASIIDIAKDNGLEEVWAVEDNLGGFLQAQINCEEAGLQLRFGYRVDCCNDLETDSEDSHKIIIFLRDLKDQRDFIKLHNLSATTCKLDSEKKPIVDMKTLRENWSSSLMLSIPFYDSYIHKNLLGTSKFAPDLKKFNPTYIVEDNETLYDEILIRELFSTGGTPHVNAKSIYYEKRDDFLPWQTYKIICGRKYFTNSSIRKPNLKHCSSREFSFESFKEKWL